MARTITNTVDYFPHVAKPGKTLFILEGKYGNDGYAFWFKLLEILSTSENHFYDASNEDNWQYLVIRAKLAEISVTEMLALLAKMGNIDPELWQKHKIIWCQGLVDNFIDVYKKRKRELPTPPKRNNCHRKTTRPRISGPEMPQSKVKESKGKNISISLPKDFKISDEIKKWANLKGFGNLEAHLEYFIGYVKAHGKKYADWNQAFKNAIREDWGKVRGKVGGLSPPLLEPTCPKCGAGWRTKTKDRIVFNCDCQGG